MTTRAPRLDYSGSIFATGWGLFRTFSVSAVFFYPALILVGGGIAAVLLWAIAHPWIFIVAPMTVIIVGFSILWMKAGRDMRREAEERGEVAPRLW